MTFFKTMFILKTLNIIKNIMLSITQGEHHYADSCTTELGQIC